MKGFVFTLDAVAAFFLLVLVVSTALFLSVQLSRDLYGPLQSVRLAQDALAVLEKNGTLSTWNPTIIGGALNATLPANLGAHLQVTTYLAFNSTWTILNVSDIGPATPPNQPAYGARRDFVAVQYGHVTNYSIARIWIWPQ